MENFRWVCGCQRWWQKSKPGHGSHLIFPVLCTDFIYSILSSPKHCVLTGSYWQWHPTLVLLPGKSHGRRSLVGCNPWGCWGSDTTVQLHFHFSLSCFGEGNGNPLQCSCLEYPGMGEPGGLPSMGSHRVGHDWSDLAALKTYKRTGVFITGN